MIDLEWLQDSLCEVLEWRLANPGAADSPAAPELPWAGVRVWGIFLRLHEARAAGGFGPASISYSDIVSFATTCGETIRPWEIDIIRALDRAYLKAVASKSNSGAPSILVAQSRPMTPALFDAVFP